MATRCCWPPDRLRGNRSAKVAQANLGQKIAGDGLGLGLRHLLHDDRAGHHVLQRRHVREEVELLEHHADTGAKARQVAAPRRGALVAEIDAAVTDLQRSGRRLFETIDAAQESGLRRSLTGRSRPRPGRDRPRATRRARPRPCRSSAQASALTITSPLLVNSAPPGGPPTG